MWKCAFLWKTLLLKWYVWCFDSFQIVGVCLFQFSLSSHLFFALCGAHFLRIVKYQSQFAGSNYVNDDTFQWFCVWFSSFSFGIHFNVLHVNSCEYIHSYTYKVCDDRFRSCSNFVAFDWNDVLGVHRMHSLVFLCSSTECIHSFVLSNATNSDVNNAKPLVFIAHTHTHASPAKWREKQNWWHFIATIIHFSLHVTIELHSSYYLDFNSVTEFQLFQCMSKLYSANKMGTNQNHQIKLFATLFFRHKNVHSILVMLLHSLPNSSR